MRTYFLILSFIVFISCDSTVEQHERKYLKLQQQSNCKYVFDQHIVNEINKQQKRPSIIPDSSLFFQKKTSNTINANNGSILNSFTNLSQEQIINWLKPLTTEIGYDISLDTAYFKAISFQKKTKKYTSVLLMMLNETSNEQFLVTIDSVGKYIDGLSVFSLKNLSNSDVIEDSVRKVYIFSTDSRSKFDDDTIKVYHLADVSQKAKPHLETDVWQELCETIYIT